MDHVRIAAELRSVAESRSCEERRILESAAFVLCPDDDLVERCARAAFRADRGEPDADRRYVEDWNFARPAYEGMARAVLLEAGVDV